MGTGSTQGLPWVQLGSFLDEPWSESFRAVYLNDAFQFSALSKAW